MNLVKYYNMPKNWDDLILNYDSKTLFHESCWHNHILSIHKNSKMEYFRIEEQGQILGYFCGIVVKKIIFKIMGSPLGGTGTNYMGPIVNSDINIEELIRAIEKMCKKERIAHFEISNDLIDKNLMMKSEFNVQQSVTHKVEITETEDIAFKNLKSSCRNRIKKGRKNNLIVEISDNAEIIDNYFDQFKEVYGKQGMVTPFGIERVKSLFESLILKNRILPIQIKSEDYVIATGLFPYDEKAIYFWGAASWLKDQKLCPNELLHWAVIQFAVQKKINVYNMCGGTNQFKNKFGGEDVDYLTYYKTYFPFLAFARSIYRKLHFLELKIRGKISSYSRK